MVGSDCILDYRDSPIKIVQVNSDKTLRGKILLKVWATSIERESAPEVRVCQLLRPVIRVRAIFNNKMVLIVSYCLPFIVNIPNTEAEHVQLQAEVFF